MKKENRESVLQWMKGNRAELIVCVVLFAFALFMMIHGLMHSDLWGDEWVEYTYSQAPLFSGWGEWNLFGLVRSTYQPPLYNIIMHFWLKVSDSLVWFRSFNIILGVIAIIFCYLTGRELYSKWVGAVSVFLLSICYQWIYMIQECSEYALMLTFLFVALYFFVLAIKHQKTWQIFCMIGACIGAIYSQYGAMFVIGPILIAYLVKTILGKDKKQIRRLLIFYVIAFVVFAVPLVVVFTWHQLGLNDIGGNTGIYLTFSDVIGFFSNTGRYLGYLFDLNQYTALDIIFGVLGVGILAACIGLLFSKSLAIEKRMIIICFLAAYVSNYLLIVLHVYAMTATPGESAGFFSRYNCFYIPLYCVVLPVLFMELTDRKLVRISRKPFVVVLAVLIWATAVYAVPDIYQNWEKAKDKTYVSIWKENGGESSYTYVLGAAHFGFEYYAQESGVDLSEVSYTTEYYEEEDFPDSFWIWRTNWGDENELLERARSEGYTIVVFDDSEYTGGLIYCEK